MEIYKDIKIEDIMCKEVISTSLPGTRDEILETLKKKLISGLPVLKNGKVAGIVTRHDLLTSPEEDQTAMLMTRNPITIPLDSNIIDTAKLMIHHSIRRLPVVENNDLKGIITVKDIIKILARLEITESIERYVDNSVVCVWDSMPLPVVGAIMEMAKISAAPVINTDIELVGMVTDKELIAASIIENEIKNSDMSFGSDGNIWTWEGIRDTMRLYYQVSRIMLPDVDISKIMWRDVIKVNKIIEVSECAKLIMRSKTEQLPVVSPTNKLKGIIRDISLLKSLIRD